MPSNDAQALPDIRKTCVVNAPIQKAWDAVATSRGLSGWFMPNDLQPAVGHEFHLDAGPYGKSPCKVIEVDPPYRLAFTWGKDWTLTFALRELDGGKTEVTVTHSGWTVANVTEFGEAHAIVRERMAGGWARLGDALRAYIEG